MLPHNFLNNVKFRVLGNQEIIRTPQNWVNTEPSAPYPFQINNFDSSGQKLRKNRYESFLVLTDLA